MPSVELHNVATDQLFADSSQRWDKGSSKPTPTLKHLDFQQKKTKVALWRSWDKPSLADLQLDTLAAESASVQGFGTHWALEGRLEVELCTRLCEDGKICDAVGALDQLVQLGCQIPSRIFHRILKRCSREKDKDLVFTRRVHALTVLSGYEGDAFLATHLMRQYAAEGNLEDVMRVFTKVSTPDVYNWATIIFAYARHGGAAQAAQAVQLYRQMCESTTTKPDNHIYTAVLKACAAAGDLVSGREVHGHIRASPQKPDRFVQAGLVNMYARCGSLQEARIVFDNLSDKDVVTWTVLIAGYTKQGMGHEALSLYRSMQQEGRSPPDSVTYVYLLQACSIVGLSALDKGKQLHEQIKERGLQVDVFLGGSLVNMYAKCGSLGDARVVFDQLRERDIVAWTTMIAGYAQQGMGEEALNLYRSMQQEGQEFPTRITYLCLLQACASVGVQALDEGRRLHAQIKEQELHEDVGVGCSLVNMYAKCGSLEDARSVLDQLPERDIIACNAMLTGYTQHGMCQEAFSLYKSIRQDCCVCPNSVTYVCLLQACAIVGEEALEQGRQLHADIKEQGLEQGAVLGGSLVNMFAKCGSLEDARMLFTRLPEKDVVTWTAIIGGYAQQGMGEEALSLYRSMQKEGFNLPSPVTYVALLQACANVGVAALHAGQQLHSQIVEHGLEGDVVVGGSLVNMYAKCGALEDARTMFEKLPERDVLAWNAILAGYVQQGIGQQALSLYKSLGQVGLTPDRVTYVCLLQACAHIGAQVLEEGKQLHAQIEKQGLLHEDVALGGSLVNMYAKCGSLEDARNVLDHLPKKDISAWNAMLTGYARQGMAKEAFTLYRCMKQEGCTHLTSVTYICLLQACAAVGGLPLGERLHSEIEERGMQGDGMVGAALVNMYAKCGSMYDSQRAFDSLAEKSVEAWGALVSGYARQGSSQTVFDLLDRMKLEGIDQNEMTFLSVLTVCSHVGLLDKGREYFNAMRDHGISATREHFVCMVDILGRAGHLSEALQLVRTMPFPPNEVVWHTLLSACWKWRNVEIGQQAFEGAVSTDDTDSASYVLMSNIYASAGMWEAAEELKARRMKFGAWKKPGQSWWTDMDGVVHTLSVGDTKHPESEGIYARLSQVIARIKKEGYVPHLDSSLLNISDHEKEAELCGHSEKLAIAYALSKTAEGTTIRIVKNLRVCEDCHAAASYISKVEKRTIICRDASRFHVHKEGKCSCGDYW